MIAPGIAAASHVIINDPVYYVNSQELFLPLFFYTHGEGYVLKGRNVMYIIYCMFIMALM